MTRHSPVTLLVALALGGLLALPAGAIAAASSSPAGGTSATPPPEATPGATSSAGGGTTAPGPGEATLLSPSRALAGSRIALRGDVGVRRAGAVVRIDRLDFRGRWQPVAGARSRADGTFSAIWRPRRSGHVTLRALVPDDARAATATTATTAPTASVTVYRPALAAWYGPTSHASRTACGQVLTAHLVGVAHRTLPCGTRVEVLYRGRTLVVPVVDRGPYANGADWDLTTAAARELRFDGVERVGTIVVGRRSPVS